MAADMDELERTLIEEYDRLSVTTIAIKGLCDNYAIHEMSYVLTATDGTKEDIHGK